jgi:hypothetical protein
VGTHKVRISLRFEFQSPTPDTEHQASSPGHAPTRNGTRTYTAPSRMAYTEPAAQYVMNRNCVDTAYYNNPTCPEEKCHFGINIICRSLEGQYGAWFPPKSGSEREHVQHSQYINWLSSTTTMDTATKNSYRAVQKSAQLQVVQRDLPISWQGRKI